MPNKKNFTEMYNLLLFKKIPDITSLYGVDISSKIMQKALWPRVKWQSNFNRSKFKQTPGNTDRPIFSHKKWLWLAKVKSEREVKYCRSCGKSLKLSFHHYFCDRCWNKIKLQND